MMQLNSAARRERKRIRVRKRVTGTPQRPRLNVFRSQKHIAAQLVDDTAGKTLAAASSLSKELREKLKSGANRAAAREVGKLIAEKAKAHGITAVVFDRAGYLYHGRVKELADGAREGGLKF